MKFRTTIELGGKTATGFVVPDVVVEKLGAGKRPSVVVRIRNHSYRTTVMPYSGANRVPLSAENREAAGVEAGDEVDVDITLDASPRTVKVPKDFASAMRAAPGTRKRFDALSFTSRKEYVRAIEEAKQPQTRERRIAKAIVNLSQDN